MSGTAIRALLLDVDGVLTDGGFWLGPGGDEHKRFQFADVMGISLARRAGLRIALVSGEASEPTRQFARKMAITELYEGIKDKGSTVREYSDRFAIPLSEICFMGDDVNDVSALAIVGLPAAPSNAQPEAKAAARWHASVPGGSGAVRELVRHLVSSGLIAEGLSEATVAPAPRTSS